MKWNVIQALFKFNDEQTERKLRKSNILFQHRQSKYCVLPYFPPSTSDCVCSERVIIFKQRNVGCHATKIRLRTFDRNET